MQQTPTPYQVYTPFSKPFNPTAQSQAYYPQQNSNIFPKLDPNNFFEKFSFQSLYSDFVSDSQWSTSGTPEKYIKNLSSQFTQNDNLSEMKEGSDNISEISGQSFGSNSQMSSIFSQKSDQSSKSETKAKKNKKLLRLNDYMIQYYAEPINTRLNDIFNGSNDDANEKDNNGGVIAESYNDIFISFNKKKDISQSEF